MSIKQRIKLFLYDSYYRNPVRRLIAANRPLPRLLIVGAQKSGTTTLFNYLITNPFIKRPLNKEIHFFSYYYHKGIPWYKTHFPQTPGESINIDASTSYLVYPKAGQRAAEAMPDAKIIAILRNPVDRAYSQFWHTKKIGKESARTFEDALALEAKRENIIQKELDANEDYCYNDMYRHAYRKRGIYVDQLKVWFDLFPRKNVLILESAQLFKDPHHELEKVSSFLNIPNEFNFTPSVYNKGIGSKKMSVETRRYLEDYYAPHNRRLFELIQDEFGW